jgi:SAM-dependent methyltransferase
MDPLEPKLPPSPWVKRFAPLSRAGGDGLDFACGRGRHARWLAGLGMSVVAVDRDAAALAGLSDVAGVRTLEADLEHGPWPLAAASFELIVVTNYLYRPRLELLLAALAPGGVLIYETFMQGNERFGRPSNPEFLLRPGELLDCLRDAYTIVAFEQGEVEVPKPAVMQRVCALKGVDVPLRLPPA